MLQDTCVAQGAHPLRLMVRVFYCLSTHTDSLKEDYYV